MLLHINNFIKATRNKLAKKKESQCVVTISNDVYEAKQSQCLSSKFVYHQSQCVYYQSQYMLSISLDVYLLSVSMYISNIGLNH